MVPPPLDAPARPGEGAGDDSRAAEELIRLTERAFQSGHPAEAVRLGKEALAAHGGARAHLALAAAYFDLRRFDDARASYEAVLQTEPGNQAARIGLDLAKTAQGRSPEPQPQP
jgi:Tfp pilus assembly protein PilF